MPKNKGAASIFMPDGAPVKILEDFNNLKIITMIQEHLGPYSRPFIIYPYIVAFRLAWLMLCPLPLIMLFTTLSLLPLSQKITL